MSARLQQLWRASPSTQRKLGMVALLLLVGLLLWGRLLLKQVPRTATAIPPVVNTGASSDKESEFASRPVVHVALPQSIVRDIFLLNASHYERTAAEVPESRDRVRSSVPKAEYERELKLEATMGGSRPHAVINGEMLTIGQTIQGFELVRIEHRSVELRRDDLVLTLEMKNP